MRYATVAILGLGLLSRAAADGGPVEMRPARAEEREYFRRMAAAMEEALPPRPSGMVAEDRVIQPVPASVPVEFGKSPVRYRARVAWREPEGARPKPRTQEQIQADMMNAARAQDHAAMQRYMQEMQAEARRPPEERLEKIRRASVDIELNVRAVYVVKPRAVQAGPGGALAYRTDDAGRSQRKEQWQEGSTVVLLGRWTPGKTPAPYLNVYAKGNDSTVWNGVETIVVRVRADEATSQDLVARIQWPVLQKLLQ
jgi:hypothetical protein